MPAPNETVNGAIEGLCVGVMTVEHLSGPGFGQSLVVVVLSMSSRKR